MAVETGRERAVYASNPAQSRGRRYAEAASPTRNAFRRDCDRIIHSPRSGGWPTRRRCSSITRATITARGSPIRLKSRRSPVRWRARSALMKTSPRRLALAHDLGHPPFGHAGERALDDGVEPSSAASTTMPRRLRIVTDLERRYAAFDGLNLSWETLEGLVKHNGPLIDRDGIAVGALAANAACRRRFWPIRKFKIWICGRYASAEAQVAALSDDIAYDAHDIDDGLRADLFTLDDIAQRAADRRHPARASTHEHPGIEPGAARARDGARADHAHD